MLFSLSRRVQVSLENVIVNASGVMMKTVSIDSSLGRDTSFTFSYTGTTFPLSVVVTSPRGRNYTADGPHSLRNNDTKQLTISPETPTEVRRLLTCDVNIL